MYVYHQKERYKHTCRIQVPGNSTDGCKILGDFGSNNFQIKNIKDDPTTIKKFNRQEEENASVNNGVDEIILQKNNKVSGEAEAQKKLIGN